MWPAECRVLAYVGPGLPMLHTSRGIGFPGGIVMAMDWGIEGTAWLCAAALVDDDCGFRFLGGLLGGLGAEDSVSEDVSGGVGSDCWAFFCLRASRLFRPARRLIASLLRYSVAGMFSA